MIDQRKANEYNCLIFDKDVCDALIKNENYKRLRYYFDSLKIKGYNAKIDLIKRAMKKQQDSNRGRNAKDRSCNRIILIIFSMLMAIMIGLTFVQSISLCVHVLEKKNKLRKSFRTSMTKRA